MSCPAEFLCLVCKDVVRLAVMMPCCAGACCQDCAKNNINIYGSCPLCLAHSHCEDLIPYRMLREKVAQYFQSDKKQEESLVEAVEESASPGSSANQSSVPEDCPSGASSSSLLLQPTTTSEPSESAPATIPVLVQEPGGVWLSPRDDTLGMFEAAMREIDAKKNNSVKKRTQLGEQNRIVKEKDLEDVSSDDFEFEDVEKLPGYGNQISESSGCREEGRFEEAANNEAEMKPKMMDEKGKVKNALMKALMNMDEYDEERIRRMRKVLESSQSIKKSKHKKEKKKKRKEEVKIKEKTLRKLLKQEEIKKEVLEEILKKKKKKRKHKKRSSDSSSGEDEVPLTESESPRPETSLNDIQVGSLLQSPQSYRTISMDCLGDSDPSRQESGAPSFSDSVSQQQRGFSAERFAPSSIQDFHLSLKIKTI